jgi:hypothetical protein
MRTEFSRYGLAGYRKLVGALQIAGATGLIFGLYVHWPLQLFAALGLTLLMMMGFGVRLKIRDTWLQAMPSLAYALLNAFIAYKLWRIS